MTDHAKKRYAKIHHGIYRIIHPLAGKKPGPVNAYLFTGTTVTLLDTGTLKSFPVLQRTLGELGMTCADIDQIVLTHGHIDHYGAAKKVIAAAGGSISLYIEKEGILFRGDHILGHITPNAFVMLESDFVLPRRMSQVEFYDSLRKIEELAPRIVYPAHGEPIEDEGKTIGMFREQFLLRQNSILSMLAGEESTVYDIGRKLFPDIRGKRLPLEIFLMVSEVYTHLQVLEKEKAVEFEEKNGALFYRKSG